MELANAKEQKKAKINEVYQCKIKEEVEDSNNQIKISLAHIAEQIEEMKKGLHHQKPRKLTN